LVICFIVWASAPIAKLLWPYVQQNFVLLINSLGKTNATNEWHKSLVFNGAD